MKPKNSPDTANTCYIKKMRQSQVEKWIAFLKRHHARLKGSWLLDTDGERLFHAKRLPHAVWECHVHPLLLGQRIACIAAIVLLASCTERKCTTTAWNGPTCTVTITDTTRRESYEPVQLDHRSKHYLKNHAQ